MGVPRLLGEGAAEIRAHPKRFFVGLLLGFLPLLSVLMVGYATKIIRKSATGGYPTLPAWWNWKQLFVDGLKVGLLLAVFNVPFFALALIVQSLGTLAGELATTLLTVLLIAAALIPAVMFLSAWKRLALTGSFKKALDIRRAWGEASQPTFWMPALKCLGLGIAMLTVGRLLGFYGLPFAAASYVFLLLLAWWLGATSVEGKTPAPTDKPKKSGPGGGSRKLTLALVALLVLGIATPFLAHIEPLELPVTQEINIFGDSIKVTAPSYWQYYWLDPANLRLDARVNETEHDHGEQYNYFPLGDTTKNTYQSWCDVTVVQTFSPEKARLYQHEQCHELDDPTDACFSLYEVGFGTTGEFLLSIIKMAVGQGMKALTGQFTPAGIAVDAVVNIVGQIINSVAGLGDNSGRATGPVVGETAGVCLEGALGENPLGQEKGLWKVKDAIKDAFKKKGVDIGKAGGFISGVGLGMITDLITDLIMKLVREMLDAMGLKGKWLLADGCANIAQTDHVDIRQSDPELWQFTGRVDVSKLFIPTGRQCQPTTITLPPGTTTGDPGNPPKTVDTIPKPPLTPDPWEPPVVDGPPLPPPIGEPPTETTGGGIKCSSDQDCYDIDQYYCSGLVAHADMGQCIKGECRVLKQSRDCDDKKELKDFANDHADSVAHDSEGRLTYLAPSSRHLGFVMEEWPHISFHKTREQN